VLVSFDVEAFYPSVPFSEALKRFDTWLKTLKLGKPLAAIYTKVAMLCMEKTQFQFRGAYYQQIFDTAMGNTLSSIIVNLFMGHMENKLKLLLTRTECWIC
jgi:hypothetical protein